MVGGCCGTNPAFIKEVSRVVKGILPRQVPEKDNLTLLSGLTEFKMTPNIRFVNVGERCNIAGSALFKKMIEKKDYEAALKVAKDQVENGAQILDINLDDGMIDGVAAMTKFCRLL